MKLPDFPESHHPLVRSLQEYSDPELIHRFQQHPDEGKYFTALFCRFGAMSYSLLRNMARSPLQVDYLFARVWRNIFYELNHLATETGGPSFSMQAWVLNKVAACITQDQLPAIETIQYTLTTAPPPLWCYLQNALDQLSPLPRLILVLSQTFHWQDHRIMAVLQAEGEEITPDEIAQHLQEAYQSLQAALPEDIQDIYLNSRPEPDSSSILLPPF
ncbi:sigma-70 family RNA polymerase sigma factor [Acaryochloris sp. IP29b_bin.148]|uniref:sigma-70 family RNA polymerase sigma factor n=1 Tax=Acaryochloris sp. IP29b_bin.148 TaxID=2969218 RepID=UPI002617BEE7|nr:sigma-70 family RNA polymerase sigma factor [Acaryochloris sp. IP29b_bin.148]